MRTPVTWTFCHFPFVFETEKIGDQKNNQDMMRSLGSWCCYFALSSAWKVHINMFISVFFFDDFDDFWLRTFLSPSKFNLTIKKEGINREFLEKKKNLSWKPHIQRRTKMKRERKKGIFRTEEKKCHESERS